MARYILNRIIRAILSIFIVVAIIFILVYGLIPKENIFNNDTNLSKYTKHDERISYMNGMLEKYGYIEFVEIIDYCALKYASDPSSLNAQTCTTNPSEYEEFSEYYIKRGYKVDKYLRGIPYAVKDKSPLQMFFEWTSNLIIIDHPNWVKDPNNPNLKREIKFGTDWSGNPALVCSGCNHKYLIYVNSSFPFIHFNWIEFNLGQSFPTFQGQSVLGAITARQGEPKSKEITFPTGVKANTSLVEHSCKYKPLLSDNEKLRFVDNYANCDSYLRDPSMMSTSFIIGVIATILAYIIGLPLGIYMARNKNKLFDKIGIAYIVFIISVPSLAYIFMFSRIGSNIFNLPVKFPQYGAQNIISYILPIISLTLPSIAGLMMWMRRYMIDQSLSDYVKFARAKGLSESSIFSKHIMRNAIIPIVHGMPMAILGSLTGAIITERVYAVPGMGKMLTSAINEYNNSMVIGLAFIFTALSVFSLLLGDILMTIVDPRITFSEKER